MECPHCKDIATSHRIKGTSDEALDNHGEVVEIWECRACGEFFKVYWNYPKAVKLIEGK